MKHLLIFISFMLLIPPAIFSQEHKIHPVSYIFNPEADAKQDINEAILKAAKQHRHVLLLVGGDWSYWSRNCSNLFNNGKSKKVIDDNFILVRVNFSSMNKNSEVLDAYQCPKDQGYPILITLDDHGKVTHTKSTAEFQADHKWYDENAIIYYLNQWAIFPAK